MALTGLGPQGRRSASTMNRSPSGDFHEPKEGNAKVPRKRRPGRQEIQRLQELKAEAAAQKDKAAGENDVLAKIDEMPEPERTLAKRLHEIIKANAPDLAPKTWYGMPAYARNGKVVCFFQSAQKFNTRYATLGFSDQANLDEGNLWPTTFALKELSDAEEARISALVQKAVSG
jgi:uncharacterized protein YdhG (YjbR/CyaY superfamily)